MKNILLTIVLVFSGYILFSQDCVTCNNNTISNNGSALGTNNTATGGNSISLGENNQSLGVNTLSTGYQSIATGAGAISMGIFNEAVSNNTLCIGSYLKAQSSNAMVIGTGISPTIPMLNTLANSLAIGLNSDIPTLFIKGASGAGTTGKIGIGDVTDPQAKLHIKGDEGSGSNAEDADILLEPGSSMKYARVKFGTAGNRIDARDNQDLNFHTVSDFVFWDANVGVGTDNPQAKLQITDGDIFIEDIDRGIIMKSPDGQCWRGTLDNNGSLNFTPVDCNNPTTSAGENSSDDLLKVMVFPNPSHGLITVKVDGDFDILYVRLSDMAGNMIFSGEMKTGKLKIREHLPAGHYLIEVKTAAGEKISSEKIVVL